MRRAYSTFSRPIVAGAALTIVLAGLQASLGGKALFLGADMSSVAGGLLRFRPWAAVAEVAKILGFMLIINTFLIACAMSIHRHITTRRGHAVAILCWTLSYAFFAAASVLRYPAMYENWMPESIATLVFHAAFVVSPGALSALSIVFLAAPIAFLVALTARDRLEWRRPVFAAAALTVVVSLGVLLRHHAIASSGRPVTILIVVDSLRADRVLDDRVMPFTRALSTRPGSARLTNNIVGVPRTFPSIVEILSGRQAPANGIRHMFPSLASRENEINGIATVLSRAGYKTAAVSDFAGDVFPRFRAGFDTIIAPTVTLSEMIRVGADQRFPIFLPFMIHSWTRTFFPSLKESPSFADPTHLIEDAMSVVDEPDDRPLFLTLFFSTSHFPYAAPYPYYTRFASSDYGGAYRFQKNPALRGDGAEMTPANIAQVRGLYDGALAAVDNSIASLWSELARRGLTSTTTIAITGDHGEEIFEEPFNWQGHGEHLRADTVLNTPLIIATPTENPPIEIPYQARSIDIAPTLAGLAAAPSRGEFEGHDWTPWIKGTRHDDPTLAAYSETGIWFARRVSAFFQEQRLDYPGVSGLLSFDPGGSDEVVLNPKYESMIATAKHRSLTRGPYRVIYVPGPNGVSWELWHRGSDGGQMVNEPARLDAMRRDLLKLARGWNPNAREIGGYFVEME